VIILMFPASEAGRLAERLLCELAAITKAWWGWVSGGRLADLVRAQFAPSLPKSMQVRRFSPPPGLPELKRPPDTAVRPHHLGWMNYWSKEAAELAGLGDCSDTDDLSLVRKVRSGWFLKLTDESFDTSNRAHLRCLRWAYRRFPGVGRLPA
jgi:hypothetical protein